MTHGSLFSGIGGFDLAAEWMGWENVFHCEWNEFGQKVLKHYWPKAISYYDITKTDFTIHRGRIDLLSGGFPCQPYSMAGKRKGKEDERHLWPEMLRAIKEIQPRWVVGENVYGLVNWSGGLVFHEVQADLEAAGYEVFPYVLPAAAVNAPHRRDRVWFVAYANNDGGQEDSKRKSRKTKKTKFKYEPIHLHKSAVTNPNIRLQQCENGTEMGGGQAEMGRQGSEFTNATQTNGTISNAPHTNSTRCENWDKQHRGQQTQDEEGKRCTCGYCIRIDQSNAPYPNGNGLNGSDSQHKVNASERGEYAQRNFEQRDRDVANTNKKRLQRHGKSTELEGGRFSNSHSLFNKPTWENFPTQSPVRFGDDGISSRLDCITFSKWRNESIKAAGNAIVPQVALQIFKTIQQYEALPRMETTL